VKLAPKGSSIFTSKKQKGGSEGNDPDANRIVDTSHSDSRMTIQLESIENKVNSRPIEKTWSSTYPTPDEVEDIIKTLPEFFHFIKKPKNNIVDFYDPHEKTYVDVKKVSNPLEIHSPSIYGSFKQFDVLKNHGGYYLKACVYYENYSYNITVKKCYAIRKD